MYEISAVDVCLSNAVVLVLLRLRAKTVVPRDVGVWEVRGREHSE